MMQHDLPRVPATQQALLPSHDSIASRRLRGGALLIPHSSLESKRWDDGWARDPGRAAIDPDAEPQRAADMSSSSATAMGTVSEQPRLRPHPQALPLCYVIAGVSGSGKSCALVCSVPARLGRRTRRLTGCPPHALTSRDDCCASHGVHGKMQKQPFGLT